MNTSRREFLVAGIGCATAALGPAAAAAAPAKNYDLVLRGGRVIDFSQKVDLVADVGILNGRIQRVTSMIADSEAAEVMDVTGKLVVPGLVDSHAHFADPKLPPATLMADGVTALVDGGSCGADNVDPFVETVRKAPNHARILINIAHAGLGQQKELHDITQADPAAARKAIERNRDWIIGIKARLSRSAALENDLEALKRARQAADVAQVPIMIHIGNTAHPLPEILKLLRPGDIVTHAYATPSGIFNADGKILDEVRDARKRGIRFDFGNGRTEHWTWQDAERALAAGFPPDSISSDITVPGRSEQVMNLPNVMSHFLTLGMPLDEVVGRATCQAAQNFKQLKQYGTLKLGAPADIAVLELRSGEFEFVDNYKTKRTGKRKLVPHATLVAGKKITAETVTNRSRWTTNG